MNTKRTRKYLKKTKKKFNCMDVKNVMIFGDSNTWGIDPKSLTGNSGISRINYCKRWTTKLQEKLGNGYNIIVEALNHRTTIFSELASPSDGDYNCIGRDVFKTLLHSQKPLGLVIIALGTNDMKEKFNTTPHDIGDAIRILVKDMERTTDTGVDQKHTPKCLILGPPVIQETPISRNFGFLKGIEKKSKEVSSHLSKVANDLGAGYLNLQEVAKVSPIDGVHFDIGVQDDIANAVALKVKELY